MGFLRIFLALSVVIFHTGPLFGFIGINGLVAVHLFFIISGFYMALIIKNKYSQSKKPYYTFISNRFLRIYPIYVLILIAVILVGFAKFQNFNLLSIGTSIGKSIHNYIYLRKPFGIIEDFSLLVRSDYLSTDMFRYDILTVGPGWTLVHEFIFYLIAPFLLFIKKRYLLLITIASISIFYLVTLYHHLKGDHYIQTYFIPANFFFFTMGIFSYYMYEKMKKKIQFKYSFVISLLFLIGIFLWNYIPSTTFRWIILKEWLMYFITPFILPLIFESFNGIALNYFFADLSYPIYISHILPMTFLQDSLGYKLTEKFFSLWTVLITVVISIILVYFIEKPLDKFRQSRIKN